MVKHMRSLLHCNRAGLCCLQRFRKRQINGRKPQTEIDTMINGADELGNVMRCSSKIVMDNTHEAKDCGAKVWIIAKASTGYEYEYMLDFHV
jgi:hypothetical protein